MSKDIVKSEKKEEGLTVVEQTLNGLTAALAGIMASDKKDWALSIGYLLQRVRGGHFLETLLAEIKKYREKGAIKDDYFRTTQGLDCTQEIIDFIDRDSPDETRFGAMKTAFLNIASEKNSKRDDPLPLQVMKICRSLSSAEILVLAASYKILKSTEVSEQVRADIVNANSNALSHLWLEYVIRETGFRFSELVKRSEEQLVEKKLLMPTIYDDGSGFRKSEYYRLTSLGYFVCSFIGDYLPKD